MSELNVAVLGMGRIGRLHAGIISRLVGFKLSSIYKPSGIDPELAQRYGTIVASSEAEAIDGADLVAICSPTPQHVDTIIAAASAGKHIFCEKPISLELGEVDRALGAANDAGVMLHVGFNRRFDPSHTAVQQAVADGSVGRVRQVTITSRDPEPPPLDYVKVSGGIFCDMTIHDFDMAAFVASADIEKVFAVADCKVDADIAAFGDFDTATVVCIHSNGVQTTINNCRQSAYGYDQRVEVFGSGGVAMSENHREHYTTLLTGDGSAGSVIPNFFLQRYAQSYEQQWRCFGDAIRSGSGAPTPGEAGRKALAVAVAARRSVDSARFETV